MTIFARKWFFQLVIIAQISCAIFFVADVVGDILVSWQGPSDRVHIVLELLAALVLVVSTGFMIALWRRIHKRNEQLELSLRYANQEAYQTIQQFLNSWGLSAAEFDVAMLAVKGFSIAEIAEIRKSSEGTIKAQLNAIYRKSDVNNRAELMSMIVDGLIAQTHSA